MISKITRLPAAQVSKLAVHFTSKKRKETLGCVSPLTHGGASPFQPSGRSAGLARSPGVGLLSDARECAQEGNVDLWQFAVEVEVLRSAGLSNTDLRWLISRALVEHRSELTRPADRTRRFRKSGLPSFALTGRDCFVLTDAGFQFVSQTVSPTAHNGDLKPVPDRFASPMQKESGFELYPALGHGGTGRQRRRLRQSGPADLPGQAVPRVKPNPRVPVWDSQLHELHLGRQTVKRFTHPAPAQELILTVLQEEGWPPAIDDPLPARFDQDPKRRLHYTVRNLNRGQHPLRIRFFINGNGETIRWEIVPQRRARRARRRRESTS